jgi:hypothetical protein
MYNVVFSDSSSNSTTAAARAQFSSISTTTTTTTTAARPPRVFHHRQHAVHASTRVSALLACFALGAATAGTAAAAAAAPSWPKALHLEGSYLETTCITFMLGTPPTCVTGNGTVVWDTLGDDAEPGASLSHEKAVFVLSSQVVPAGAAGRPSVSELWQTCPSHASFKNGTTVTGALPATKEPCATLPAPCLHRLDPISRARAACKSWKRGALPMPGPEPGLADEHNRGSDCNFTAGGPPVPPGVKMTSAGFFDVWLNQGDVLAFRTHVLTTVDNDGAHVITNSTETVVTTFSNNSPDPAVFGNHCTPL